MKKEKKITNDNKKIINDFTRRIYKGIFNLNTPLLVEHYWSVYRELVSRDDFNSLDDLKMSYEIIKDELKERGVDNV